MLSPALTTAVPNRAPAIAPTRPHPTTHPTPVERMAVGYTVAAYALSTMLPPTVSRPQRNVTASKAYQLATRSPIPAIDTAAAKNVTTNPRYDLVWSIRRASPMAPNIPPTEKATDARIALVTGMPIDARTSGIQVTT